MHEGFSCYNMQYNPDIDIVKDMVGKRELFLKRRKRLLQTLSKRINNSVYGENIRRDVINQYSCVTEKWTRENYDNQFKEWWPRKNGNLIVKLEDDASVDDQ